MPNSSGDTPQAGTLLLVLASAGLIALAAQPLVVMWPVNLTLQTVAIPVIAALLGARRAVTAVALWLLAGALGLPVLPVDAGQVSGLAVMAGPAGGHLAGCLLMALIVGWAAERAWCTGLPLLFAAMVAADIVLHAAGSGWLSLLYDARTAVDRGIAPYILPDLVMLAAAAHLAWSLRALPARLAAGFWPRRGCATIRPLPAAETAMPETPERDATDALVLDLVEWLAAEPRPYAEVMEAWRTSCPRLPVWEEAVSRGLVARDAGDGFGGRVGVTPAGLAALAAAGRARPQCDSCAPTALVSTVMSARVGARNTR